jgi:hypothetical protein
MRFTSTARGVLSALKIAPLPQNASADGISACGIGTPW